jgi:hypothetical protein
LVALLLIVLFCYASLKVKGIAFKNVFRLLDVCCNMVRYSLTRLSVLIESHSIHCGLGSRVRPLRGKLWLIKVAKLLPSASTFRFCECCFRGGKELDEFPWGLAGSDDTSMTQMGCVVLLPAVLGAAGNRRRAVKKGLDD